MFIVATILCAVALLLLQLLRTRYNALSPIPGPFLASFSNIWKVISIYRQNMHLDNVAAHQRYGPVVRIGPHHVSVSSPEAFSQVHASRSAFPKVPDPRQLFISPPRSFVSSAQSFTDFYKVGAPSFRNGPLENLFSIRDAQYHATLRKNIGGLYTKSAVKEFEPQIADCVALFLRRMKEEQGKSLDMSSWVHFYAYDSLSQVNVSQTIGFLENGRDMNGWIEAADRVFVAVGLFTQSPILHSIFRMLSSILLTKNSEPLLLFANEKLEERQKSSEKKTDMLNKFLTFRESHPEKVSLREIHAAIYINLMAGHDVLAITLRAIWYYLAQNPRVVKILREEIATARREEGLSDHEDAQLPYAKASSLPYLDAVLHETFRIHPNTGTILERKVPKEGVTIDGYHLPANTTVGVNAWVLHRDRVFGADVDVYRPERWIEATAQERIEMKKLLFTFGAGTHTCIGQHIAMIQIVKVAAEFFHRFEIELTQPERAWKVMGSWVTKQTGMDMVVTGAFALDLPPLQLVSALSFPGDHCHHLHLAMSDSTAEPHYPPGYLEEDRSSQVIVASSFILVLTTILLAMRLYARSLTKAVRGWDEFLLVPSYICLMGLIVCLYCDVIYGGLGRHTASVMAEDPKMMVTFAKLLYILDWFYVPSNCLSRISVVALYLRIFTSKLYRGICWFAIAFLIANMLSTIIAAQLECVPLAYTWDKTLPGGGKCFDQILWYEVSNIPNVVGDLMILVLPIPTVWGLKASAGRKLGIAMVFFMGSIGLFASCMRTGVFFRDSEMFKTDATWATESFSWTAVECGMYFSAACLIGMRPLFSKLPRWLRDRILHPSDRGNSTLEARSGTGPAHSFKRSHHRHRPYLNLSSGRNGTGTDPEAAQGEATQLTSMNGVMTSTVVSPRGSGFEDDEIRNLVKDDGDIRIQTRIEVKSDRGGY
ncbi:cytochrome P450 [Aspergillus affinis]|uniref:cytochrome P450 n=1 Tax=Aspergillus affinis TaxID=1070780 RepID=UPI0022FE195C|nr:cytochrome P450 [Aspergillus affinis]KAI9036750.1 cytochrome P450 [Aspergillus affinis]